MSAEESSGSEAIRTTRNGLQNAKDWACRPDGLSHDDLRSF